MNICIRSWFSSAFIRLALGSLPFVVSDNIFANEAYVPADGRLSAVNLTNNSRAVQSGWNLPASGFVAVSPVTGDLYTADQSDHAVYHINRTNGTVTMVSGPGLGTGPAFSSLVFGIVVETNGTIAVVDGVSGLLAVVSVDPATGNRSILSAGVNAPTANGTGAGFQSPFGISVEHAGTLLITDINRNAVIRVDPMTGNRTVVSGDPFGDNVGTGPDLSSPAGITVRSDGTIFVSDSGGNARVVAINPTNGNRVVLTSVDTGDNPIYGLAMQTNGTVIAAFEQTVNNVPVGGAVLGINSTNGSQTFISGVTNTLDLHFGGTPLGSGSLFLEPVGTTIDRTGLIITSDVLNRSLFVIDPTTGNRSVLTNSRTGTGLDLYSPQGVAVTGTGAILIADDGDSTQDVAGNVTNRQPLLLQVDPATGNRTVVSAGSNTSVQRGSGGNFDQPKGVAVESAGTFVVADAGSSNPKIVRVDPATGNRIILSSSSVGTGTNLVAPYGIAVEFNGSFIVTDIGRNALLRIDPSTGNRVLVSGASKGSGTSFSSIKGVCVLPDGSYAVANAVPAMLFHVDPVTGNRTVVSSASQGSGPAFASPCGVVYAGNGQALVIDSSLFTLVQVDLTSGNRVVIASPTNGTGPAIQAFPQFLALQTSPELSLLFPHRLANSGFQFSFEGSLGTPYSVLVSTDLINWIAFTNVTGNGTTNTITDTTVLPRRFYRAVFAP